MAGGTFSLTRIFPNSSPNTSKTAKKDWRKRPSDPDLLRHMAYLYGITGKPQKSEAYFRKAEKLCRAELRDAIAQRSPPEYLADTQKKLRHILARDAQTDY